MSQISNVPDTSTLSDVREDLITVTKKFHPIINHSSVLLWECAEYISKLKIVYPEIPATFRLNRDYNNLKVGYGTTFDVSVARLDYPEFGTMVSFEEGGQAGYNPNIDTNKAPPNTYTNVCPMELKFDDVIPLKLIIEAELCYWKGNEEFLTTYPQLSPVGSYREEGEYRWQTFRFVKYNADAYRFAINETGFIKSMCVYNNLKPISYKFYNMATLLGNGPALSKLEMNTCQNQFVKFLRSDAETRWNVPKNIIESTINLSRILPSIVIDSKDYQISGYKGIQVKMELYQWKN